MFATIDRYVLREVATALAGVTVVLLAILVSYQLARILKIAAEHGLPHDIVLALIGLTTLENLIVLVPISMLLATMLALGRLYHESEMAAVKACGIGPERLYLPVYALALPVAAVLAWLTFVVGPDARNGAEELRGRGLRDAEFGQLTPGTFRTYADGKAVFYAEESGADGRLIHVFMQHHAGDRIEVATAAWAEQRVLAGGRTQIVVLHDGERIEGVPGQAGFRRIRFAEHGIPVVVPEAGAGRTVPERKPSRELIGSRELVDIAELQRRISMPVIGARARVDRRAAGGVAPARGPLCPRRDRDPALLRLREPALCRPGLDREGQAPARGRHLVGARALPGRRIRADPPPESRHALGAPQAVRQVTILDRYLAKTVLLHTLMVMAVLLALMTLVTFIGQQDDIGQGSYDVAGAFLVTLLQLPQQAYQLLPIGALIGAIIGLGGLARDSELTVVRAAGVSVGRIAVSAALAGLVVAALLWVIGEYFAPAGRPVRAPVQDLQPLLAARVRGQPQRLGA